MHTTTIVPGLSVTGDLYEAAAAGVAAHAPDLPALTWEAFVDPGGWMLIPDVGGELSKAELVLLRSPSLTVKLNVWHRPDLRGDTTPMPHNHPWPFVSHVLAGGYDEDRYTRGGDVVRAVHGVAHPAPTANRIDHETFHEVYTIHDPGRTLSLMVCGEGRRGDWGYLDLDTGRYLPSAEVQPVTDFKHMLAALNPHQAGR